MENTEKFRMRKYSKQTGTYIYHARRKQGMMLGHYTHVRN